LANLLERRVGVLAQQSLDGHDLARRAVSALEGIVLDECLLDGTERLASHQALDGGDLGSLSLEREHHARVAWASVDEHCARPALAPLASGLGAGETQPVPDGFDERRPRLDGDSPATAIHLQNQIDPPTRLGDW
jgi:hypothetical protein